MSLLEKKQLNAEQLSEVSGGGGPENTGVNCPRCGHFCWSGLHIVTRGEGCDETYYWRCPKCGNEWSAED